MSNTSKIVPGQIWTAVQENQRWNVLVIKVCSHNFVKVAPISNCSKMMSVGDYLVIDEKQGYFAEMWNIYCMPISWLIECVDMISAEKIAFYNEDEKTIEQLEKEIEQLRN